MCNVKENLIVRKVTAIQDTIKPILRSDGEKSSTTTKNYDIYPVLNTISAVDNARKMMFGTNLNDINMTYLSTNKVNSNNTKIKSLKTKNMILGHGVVKSIKAKTQGPISCKVHNVISVKSKKNVIDTNDTDGEDMHKSLTMGNRLECGKNEWLNGINIDNGGDGLKTYIRCCKYSNF